MGNLEHRHAKRVRRTKINQAIFTALAAGFALGSGNFSAVIDALSHNERYKRKMRFYMQSRVSRLVKDGYLAWEHGEGKSRLTLTETGKAVALQMSNGASLIRPKRWDGKWRVLIFDVPERRRYMRQRIRQTLSTLGFVRLQDSVWVFPYDCEDYITILKTDLKIGKDVLYMIVDQIENDAVIRAHFALPPAK